MEKKGEKKRKKRGVCIRRKLSPQIFIKEVGSRPRTYTYPPPTNPPNTQYEVIHSLEDRISFMFADLVSLVFIIIGIPLLTYLRRLLFFSFSTPLLVCAYTRDTHLALLLLIDYKEKIQKKKRGGPSKMTKFSHSFSSSMLMMMSLDSIQKNPDTIIGYYDYYN